jgi:hypothetical protein
MNDADLAWCINRLKTAAEERAHYDAAVDCKCEICTRINGMIEATDTAEDRIVAEIRADEREQCCKDICGMCRNGRVATRELRKDAAYWCHDLDTCFAASIRERAWSWTGRSVTG